MDALLRELSWDPQARRRRLLTVGLVLSSVLVLGGAAELTRRAHASREAQLCSGAREALGDVWSAGRAAVLERAFSATAAPFAAQAWRRTREALDGYSTQWLLAHRQACEATRRRGEQSEAVMMLRMACLHQRRTQLGAVVQVLGEADREVVEKADQVTGALPSLAGCADVGALTTLAEPPAGAAAQAELEALRRALARGVAEQEAGRYEASQATLEPLVARAQALGYAPLSAEVLTAFGTLTETRGLKGPACERLRQAIVLAERGNAQEQRVRAQIEAMIAFANFGRFDEAWVWADLAEAFLARTGRSDATFVDWAAAAGWVASQQGRYADAVAHYQRAMEAGDKLSPYPQLWRVYSRAGVALSHAGRGADGLATLQRAEALLVERLGADHPQRAFVLLNTSLVHMDEDRPAQAAAVLERAVELATRTMAKPTSGVATIHANLAAAYFELQRYDEGLAAQAKALAISDELGDVRNRGLARLNQAHVLVLLARFPEALEASRLALKDFEQTVPDDHEYVADGLSWRGAAALELGQRAQAVGDLERALAWFENPARTTTRYDVNASNVRFLLARALWPDANQRQRSRGLAGEALRGYEAAKSEPEAERVRAWLARPR